MLFFMLKFNFFKGVVSIKCSVVFVNENLLGGRFVVFLDVVEKESGGIELFEYFDGFCFCV